MLIAEKIALFLTIWIVIMLFITGDTSYELFIVLILIGFLVVKEFTDRYTTTYLKHRLNIYIIVFAMIFFVLIGRKILNFIVT